MPFIDAAVAVREPSSLARLRKLWSRVAAAYASCAELALASVVGLTLFLVPLAYRPPRIDPAGTFATKRALFAAAMTMPKEKLTLIGSFAVVMLLLAWRATGSASVAARISPLPKSWRILLLALAGGIAAATLASPQWAEGFAATRPYVAMAAIFLATAVSARARPWAMEAIRWSATILALVVLVEEWGVYLPGKSALTNVFSAPPSGPVLHRNLAGLLLMAATPLALFRAATTSGSRRVIPAVLSFALIVGALVATRSRTSWLGAAAGASFLVLAIPQVRKMRLGRTVLIAATVCGVLALRSQSPFANQYVSVTKKVAVTVRGPSVDKSTRARLDIWRFAMTSIAEKPWLGMGGGQFAIALQRARGTRFSAHNQWLHLAAEWGLPVTALFLFGVGLTLQLIWRIAARPALCDGVAPVAAAALFGALVASFFETTLIALGANLWIAALIGTAVAGSSAPTTNT